MPRTNRRKGTGTIYLSGQVYYGKIMVGGKLTKVKLTTNKRESERKWAEWLDVNRPRRADVGSVQHPIGDIWPTVRDGLLAAQMTASIKAYQSEWEKFVAHFGADTDLASLTRGQIIEYIESRSKGSGLVVQNGIVAKLRRFYAEVLPDLKTSENPLTGFKTVKDETISRQPFTDEELRRIIGSARNAGPEWELLFLIGLYTGMRFTDCVHLRRSQVKEGVIHLTPKKTMRRAGTSVHIPVHPVLKEKLTNAEGESDWFLPSLVKMTDEKRSLAGYYVRQIFEKAGIKTDVEIAGRRKRVSVKSFHALRATFISRLAEGGVSLGVLQDIAGHVSPQMTQVYVHPNQEVKERAVMTLGNFETGEAGEVFHDPVIDRIISEATDKIEEVLEKKLGQRVPVKLGLTLPTSVPGVLRGILEKVKGEMNNGQSN
jgi:integrase